MRNIYLRGQVKKEKQTRSRKEGRQPGTQLGQSKEKREFQKGECASSKVTETSNKVETEQKPLDLRKPLLTFIRFLLKEYRDRRNMVN